MRSAHRLRVFVPQDEKFFERRFNARLEADYGVILPITLQKLG
jgi:hypothetical protein